MPFDSDVALFGTGLAPLIAASHFLSQGKEVLLINPDHDFFLEDSELPLDPLAGSGSLTAGRAARSLPEVTLGELRPFFPGAVEFWSSEGEQSEGFHDPAAPHVRSRARLWMPFSGPLEDFYVEALDLDLHPQLLEGLQATTRFPGVARPRPEGRGLLVPRLCDVDVARYRNGVLEFVRERAGPSRVVCDATQVERMPGGLRFHAQGASHTAKVREGTLVFWTPRMSAWILTHARRFEVTPRLPLGVRLWEHWKVFSREPLDPSVVATFGRDWAAPSNAFEGEITVWAESEGVPSPNRKGLNQLGVLRAGPQLPIEESALSTLVRGRTNWASSASFAALSTLFHDFLGWDRYSILSLKPRAVLEWSEPVSWSLLPNGGSESDRMRVVVACDGPLVDVVRNVRFACDELEREGAA